MRYIAVFLYSIFLCMSCSNQVKQQEYVNDNQLRLEIDTLISGIVADNRLNDEGVGIAWARNAQWERFVRLSEIATEEELIRLTDHENAVVRGYSFRSLAKIKSSQVFPILVKHLSDTANVTTYSGCIMSTEMLGDYLIDVVFTTPIDSGTYQLNTRERAIIDSILLFDKSIKLSARTFLLLDIDIDDIYYDRIREIATEGKERFALPILAKYKRKADKQLIVDKLLSTDKEDWYYGLMAVRNYPDPDFLPSVIKLYDFEMTHEKGLTIPGIKMLYQALVQYRNEISRELIQKTLSQKENRNLRYHNEYIYLALSKYPHKIYNGLKDQLKLTDLQLQNVEYSMKSDT